jgi:hypothetical protein
MPLPLRTFIAEILGFPLRFFRNIGLEFGETLRGVNDLCSIFQPVEKRIYVLPRVRVQEVREVMVILDRVEIS